MATLIERALVPDGDHSPSGSHRVRDGYHWLKRLSCALHLNFSPRVFIALAEGAIPAVSGGRSTRHLRGEPDASTKWISTEKPWSIFAFWKNSKK
ncbi:hypothetical protein [Streptomyces sp. NPDC057623]|uniref:hypothetical protein n=1 Tax=Streptomyces sp. NPDC057623 TaxID=3346187 RepID=UPI0036CA5E73